MQRLELKCKRWQLNDPEGWPMTASLVALGVRWGIWPITAGHRMPLDERGVLCNAARSTGG